MAGFEWRARLREGTVIPAHPLALTAARKLDERRQRALTRYYIDAGAGGIAVGVHTTQFAIRDHGLYHAVLALAADEACGRDVIRIAGVCGRLHQALAEAECAAALGYHAALLSFGALPEATTAELIFGRDIEGRAGVSDEDWRRFIDEDVTPRFPDGFSVMDVQGQWRASNGTLIREPSKALYIVLDGGPDDGAKIAHIRDAYKQRFRQQSVLLVTRPGCVSF